MAYYPPPIRSDTTIFNLSDFLLSGTETLTLDEGDERYIKKNGGDEVHSSLLFSGSLTMNATTFFKVDSTYQQSVGINFLDGLGQVVTRIGGISGIITPSINGISASIFQHIGTLTSNAQTQINSLLGITTSHQSQIDALNVETASNTNNIGILQNIPVPLPVPVGTIIMSVGVSTPDGYLPMRGNWYLSKAYASLYLIIPRTTWNAIGGTPPSGWENPFYLPDLNGAFLRGSGTNVKTQYNKNVGGAVGTFQSDLLKSHMHQYRKASGTQNINSNLTNNRARNDDDVIDFTSTPFDTSTAQPLPTSNETRPMNMSVMYFIKF